MQVHSRRSFIRLICLLLAGVCTQEVYAAAAQTFVGNEVLNRILQKARAEKWKDLPIGEVMGKIAMQLEGTPYQAGTLDVSREGEICTVNLCALDCVTFVETTLDLARILKRGKASVETLMDEVRYTRYRNGKQGNYATRLHYTSDWLLDNERRGVLTVLSKLPGALPFHPSVNFMSSHAQLYPQLVANPQLVSEIKTHEEKLNSKQLTFVPIEKIAGVEALLKTGDIVALCSRVPGLDIEHTGLVIRVNGVARFMDASSKKSNMKVTLEAGPLHEAIAKSNKIRGVVVARPREL